MKLPRFPLPRINLSAIHWWTLSFTSAVRGLVVGLGAVAAVMGMMGLTGAMATNLAAAGLVVWPAVIAGAVLFMGGLGTIAWIWRAGIINASFLKTNVVHRNHILAKELMAKGAADQTPPRPPTPIGGKPELKTVS